MHTISYYLGISKQSEVLFLVLAGICCTIFDASLFNLHTNLYKVWNAPLDPSKFTDTAQLYVKYILSSIVLVRTFTVHLYLAFYIVMLWPAIFEEKAGLLIPWLTVGAIKCLAMGAMSFSTGLYICLTYRFSKAACWDFLIAQVIDQAPSIYMWFCVLSYYYDLKRKATELIHRPVHQTPSTVFSLAERRRRVRGLFADIKLETTFEDERKLISVSTIDNIINQLNISLRRDMTRSLDSLLAKMAAEAEKEEILNAKDEAGEEEADTTCAERALKALNLSPSYVESVKSRSKSFEKSVTSSKDREKNLKVKSSPLLLMKKPMSDIRRKDGKNSDRTTVKKSSDDLSLILSETELNSIGFCEKREDTNVHQLTQVHLEDNFDVDSQFAVEFSEEKNLDEIAEVNDTEISSKEEKIEENEENIREIYKESAIKKSSILSARLKGSKIPCKINGVKVTGNSEKSGEMETKKEKGEKEQEPKTRQKSASTKLSLTKSQTPTSKHLKSKSQAITNNLATSSPTFKYDGYTLAYIESLQKKAATDLMKNHRRPRTSGT